MSIEALIVLGIIVLAIVLFATEILSIDLVAIILLAALVLTGVLTPEEGIEGFSNPATITVAFMFVLSSALLKTGALQQLGPFLSGIFKKDYTTGIILMMIIVAFISAFINNTPVVALFIPVVIQIANSSGISPSKLLIPLSFASIFGGTCTLIGTSTTILVSGIAVKNGLDPISMFQPTSLGIILLIAGVTYMILIGRKILPDRKSGSNLEKKFRYKDYITEIELLKNSSSVGKKIMHSPLVKDIGMDIIDVRRDGTHFPLPPGDMELQAHDLLKVQCNIDKLKDLKDRIKIEVMNPVKIGNEDVQRGDTTIVEMIITSNSEFEGKTLKEVDFRRKYRAVPLAIRHREELLHDQLHDIKLKAGDVILTEIKSHHIEILKNQEVQQKAPFVIVSEEGLVDFKKKKFFFVIGIIMTIVALAAMNVVNIMIGAISGVILIAIARVLNMKEVYNAIDWKIVFLLAGTLSLGTAMQKTGLANDIALTINNLLGGMGPIAVLSGIYLTTSVLTEIMSNNAAAALAAPIAIVTAQSMGVSPTPFLMAIVFASSASFMTPIGYQTNTMIYSAGQYKFKDFLRIGTPINILFWLISTFLIPLIYVF